MLHSNINFEIGFLKSLFFNKYTSYYGSQWLIAEFRMLHYNLRFDFFSDKKNYCGLLTQFSHISDGLW